MKSLSRIILAAIVLGSSSWLLTLASQTEAIQDPEVQFQRAVQLETIEGNLNAAIDLYKQVINNNGNNRAIAAKALLRLGGCYEKQGDAAASKAYEQLLRDYADQADSAAEARTRLAALRKPAGSQSGPMTRRIWAGPKTDFFGEVSPDGKYISFVDWDTGDLAIRDLAKGVNRRLTDKGSWVENSNEEAESSIWSPDSKQVAYQWCQWKTKPANYELRLISLDNPTPRVLYRNEKFADCIYPHDWTPDGRHILATLRTEEEAEEMVLVSVVDGKVHSLKRLSQGMGDDAVISPDGRYIVYDYPQSESSLARDIFLMPIDGGTETALIKYPADDLVLGWSPDGKWVLFSSDRRGSVDVWAIQIEDGKPKGSPVMVKAAVGRITPLGITRSGSFYFGVGGERNDVYVAKLDPTTGDLLAPTTKLIKQSEGFNRYPQYSPDGKYLAYISNRNALHIRSLETGKEREYQSDLTRAGAREFGRPYWSPDGKSILLFGQDNRARDSIHHLNLETGKVVKVPHSSEGSLIGYPAGWRNARSFIHQRYDEKNDRAEICVRDLHNGSDRVLFSISPVVNGAAYVSPDRRWVSSYEIYPSGENALRIISSESGEVRQLFKFNQGEGPDRIRHAWSADSKYVLYLKVTGDKWEVWRISVDSGRMQKTGLETPTVIDNMSAHPDGERLAFEHWGSKAESPREVWAMDNFLTQSRKE